MDTEDIKLLEAALDEANELSEMIANGEYEDNRHALSIMENAHSILYKAAHALYLKYTKDTNPCLSVKSF